jgi:ADP-ribosyl-[dinitrogen reductase] hydrolase
MKAEDKKDRFIGCLLGLAVGDALGLPREGLSPGRASRLFGDPPLSHRLIAGRGMVSDDTEHACMTLQALLASQGEPERFANSLAWKLRFWFLGLPAGIGFATLRSALKLWIGFPASKSGVNSAGCGPAMRAPVIGAYSGNDEQMIRLNIASTRLTHTDSRAREASLLVALATREAIYNGPDIAPKAILANFRRAVSGEELLHHLEILESHLERGATANEVVSDLGLKRGVTGYINHVVPVSLFCWLRYKDDFRKAVETSITLGGDTDTVGAVVGALMGATLGAKSIPPDWIDHLIDWPRSVKWISQIGERLAQSADMGTTASAIRPIRLFWPVLPLRNLIFFLCILFHGLRRLLPPYY